jgi:hypothetical protein
MSFYCRFLGHFVPQPDEPAIWEFRFNEPGHEDGQVLHRTTRYNQLHSLFTVTWVSVFLSFLFFLFYWCWWRWRE